jgi:hypothetical protein
MLSSLHTTVAQLAGIYRFAATLTAATLCPCVHCLPVFLPARPGTLPHAAHDPDRAHRELHFRLLRHDVIGPVCDASQAFRQFGGVAGLSAFKVRYSTP